PYPPPGQAGPAPTTTPPASRTGLRTSAAPPYVKPGSCSRPRISPAAGATRRHSSAGQRQSKGSIRSEVRGEILDHPHPHLRLHPRLDPFGLRVEVVLTVHSPQPHASPQISSRKV